MSSMASFMFMEMTRENSFSIYAHYERLTKKSTTEVGIQFLL